MIDKNKVLQISNVFTKSTMVEGGIESLFIEGYASTSDADRAGDVVPASVWAMGMKNYLKNPVILAYHDHSEPVGRMTENRVDGMGLWIKARVSAAAEKVFNLVKDSVLTGFSVSFRVLDAEYNSAAEIFVIKELELLEISLVSVPANQNTLFSLSKSFDNDEDYKSFKMSFQKDALPKESSKSIDSPNKEEIEMTPEQLEQLLKDTAIKAAEETARLLADQKAKADAETEAKLAEEKALNDKIAAGIKVGESGAEKLLKDLEKRLADQDAEQKTALAEMSSVINEKSAELIALQKSKMQFSNASSDELAYADREKAVWLAKVKGVPLDSTKYFNGIKEKAGAHVANATWELEVSLNMENEVRRRLVVANTLRNIAMQTNVMTLPLNPEAGAATWITNAQFGTSDSAGAAQTHQLSEITLNAYKVATREYVAYEEEEDALLAVMPVVRDAMIRRVGRAVDIAMLRGAGAGADPVKGLVTYDAASTVSAAVAASATIANMIAMRKDIGAWGLDPTEVVYIVSTDIYYDLLADTTFQTVDKISDRATLLTGQIGAIGNSPVLVSAEFEAKAATKAGAICFNPRNFVVGNQRGLRFDTQELVETQRKVMVSSLRTGMVQLTTNLGGGVSAFRWTA